MGQLASSGKGWIGYRIVLPGEVATLLAAPSLAKGRVRRLRPLESTALLDSALDRALDNVPTFEQLAHGLGFRDAVHEAVRELRLAGTTSEEWLGIAGATGGARARLLGSVLAYYEAALERERLADEASEARAALSELERWGRDDWPPILGADQVCLHSGLRVSGLIGDVLASLLDRGAEMVPVPPVVGLGHPTGLLWREGGPPGRLSLLEDPAKATEESEHLPPGPSLSFFRAASITDELREVLRRVIASGARWDEVEVIASDPGLYGAALHALAARLGVPVTYGAGLGSSRTRVGRAVTAYLDWIENGYHANVIRRLLEAGDLRPQGRCSGPSAGDLARRFRGLRIGWGRDRYLKQLDTALAVSGSGSRGLVGGVAKDGEVAGARAARTAELQALDSILRPVLDATPTAHAGEIDTSAAQLATRCMRLP